MTDLPAPPNSTAEQRITEAIELLLCYGNIDGGHHKMWTIDQALRVLTGCKKVTKTGVDYKGHTYMYSDLDESDTYKAIIAMFCNGEDGPHTYEWDTGTPP